MPPIKPGSKYHRLFDHLRRQTGEAVVMTFDQIECLIGGDLPPSARAGRAFWSNRSRGALQASAWMAAGFHVQAVDLASHSVTFARPQRYYRVQRQGDAIQWDGELVRALRDHLRVSQSGLAEILGVRQQTVSEWEKGIYSPTRARSNHLTMVAEKAGFPFEESGPNTGDLDSARDQEG
jgi:DNA-binding XRE family transcriptional regulator